MGTVVTVSGAGRTATLPQEAFGEAVDHLLGKRGVEDDRTAAEPAGDDHPERRPALAIPGAGMFGFDDFLADRRLDALAAWCCGRDPELADARRARIVYRWKRKGGKTNGRPVLGKCKTLTGETLHFAGPYGYLVWLAADHCAEAALVGDQLEALMTHSLLHVQRAVDEESGAETWGLRGHDFEGFSEEIERFGLWTDDLVEMGSSVDRVRQLGLGLGLGGL